MTASTECREAFEKWQIDSGNRGMIQRATNGPYVWDCTDRDWRVWQACWLAREVLGGAVNLPESPTNEMVDAAMAVNWSDEDMRGSVINMWYAMLAKAPARLTTDALRKDAEMITTLRNALDWIEKNNFGGCDTLELISEIRAALGGQGG